MLKQRTFRCSACPLYGHCPECWVKYKKRQNDKVGWKRERHLCIWGNCPKKAVATRVNKYGAYCQEHRNRRITWYNDYNKRIGVVKRSDKETIPWNTKRAGS